MGASDDCRAWLASMASIDSMLHSIDSMGSRASRGRNASEDDGGESLPYGARVGFGPHALALATSDQFASVAPVGQG